VASADDVVVFGKYEGCRLAHLRAWELHEILAWAYGPGLRNRVIDEFRRRDRIQGTRETAAQEDA
jgi:hypothetical protein